jgi:hypothetical protein
VPLYPAYKAGTGHVPVKFQIADRRLKNKDFQI